MVQEQMLLLRIEVPTAMGTTHGTIFAHPFVEKIMYQSMPNREGNGDAA